MPPAVNQVEREPGWNLMMRADWERVRIRDLLLGWVICIIGLAVCYPTLQPV